MSRLLKVFCPGVLLLLLVLSGSYAEGESGFIPARMSVEKTDSLGSAKEPTLQEILDGLGYTIDVQNDRLPTEAWEVIPGQYGEVMLEELGGAPGRTMSGWYEAGNRYDTTVIFRGANAPPDSASFYVTGCDSNGLFLAPFNEEAGCHYMYYTEQRLNPDNKDHAWVYCSGKRPNEFIVAWEDELFLGDQDYNDLVLVYRMPNRPPVLEVPNDTGFSLCKPDTICFNDINAYDLDYCGDTVVISKAVGPGIYEAGTCCFLAAPTDSVYTFVFVATDWFGAADTDTVIIAVDMNDPPELTCPDAGSVRAGETFISTDFSVTDPNGDSTWVTFLDIDPSVTNDPTTVDSHVEWITTLDEDDRDYRIRLVATDTCGLADTCEFAVTVVSDHTGALTCPEDDSVHATVPAVTFVSTNFSLTGPGADPANVRVISVDPSPAAGMPARVESHIEWLTDCDDAGKLFTICLEATFDVGPKDTCCFEVTVYNRPPELTCPDDGMVYAGSTFVSTDFSVADPDGDSAPVTFLDINPSASNDPTVMDSHVEWVTTSNEADRDFRIRLVATDPCGLADTCEFTVSVVSEPTGVLECPEDDSIHATEPPLTFVSTNFTITGPGADPASVTVCGVEPSPANWPTIVESHVEWQAECADANKVFTICLQAPVGGGVHDTCHFEVTVYNRPPELICPDYGQTAPKELFVSTDFHATDPDEDPVTVAILDINPPATFDPVIKASHVEWTAACGEEGTDYVIRLVATDPCGLKDTCEFTVSVSLHPSPDFYMLVHPLAQYVTAGHAAGYLVELNSMYGFAGPCTLFVCGLPNPPHCGVFDQVIVVPTNSTNLTVHTAAQTDTGTYTLTITGKEISGPAEHSVQVYLQVLEASDAGDWADGPNAPDNFTLFQNQPNPFNPETHISYYLPRACRVELTIYNLLGQRVKTLCDGYQSAGVQGHIWDGKDEYGVQLSSGIYFYRLQADDFDQTRKMTLMK